MAAVSVVVPKYDPKSGRPKMVIQGSNGDAFIVPWAPRGVTHDGLYENVIEIERPGRVSDLAVKSPGNHKMSFELTIGKDISVSCEPDLKRLEAIVNVGGWIMILYGLRETGLWKCTSFTYNSIEREPSGNQISRAQVNFNFTEVPDSRKVVAEYSNNFNFRDDAVTADISAGLVATAAAIRAKTPTGVSNGSIQTPNTSTVPPYVVKQGDTLLSIAQKFYGEYAEQFWRVVGDVNRVAGQLNIGQILRIP